jgi:predicted membrane channel-forming protein YqfA (hemolysin III family)
MRGFLRDLERMELEIGTTPRRLTFGVYILFSISLLVLFSLSTFFNKMLSMDTLDQAWNMFFILVLPSASITNVYLIYSENSFRDVKMVISTVLYILSMTIWFGLAGSTESTEFVNLMSFTTPVVAGGTIFSLVILNIGGVTLFDDD